MDDNQLFGPILEVSFGTDSSGHSDDSWGSFASTDDGLNEAFILEQGIGEIPAGHFATLLNELINATDDLLNDNISPNGSNESLHLSDMSNLSSNVDSHHSPHSPHSPATDTEGSISLGGGKRRKSAFNNLLHDVARITKILRHIKIRIKPSRKKCSHKRTFKKIKRTPSPTKPRKRRITRKKIHKHPNRK
jgi:hypothetical protein